MTVNLVTGYKGEAHVTSSDQGSFNAGVFGENQYVLERGNQLSAQTTTNNNVAIKDGDIIMQGRHIRIADGTVENVEIETGTIGKNRIDKIVMTYELNADDSTENAYIEVIKGTQTSSTPTAPAHTTGDLFGGATKNQMPLYTVQLTGVNTGNPVQQFQTISTIGAFDERIATNASNIATLSTDYILEQSSSNPLTGVYWKWRKWNSGKLELWVSVKSVTGSTAVATMGGYYSKYTATFPSALSPIIDNYSTVVAAGQLGTGIGFPFPTVNSTGVTIGIHSSANSASITGSAYITARWK